MGQPDHHSAFDAIYSGRSMYYGSRPRERFIRAFEHTELLGRQALDLGCGEGRHALYLARRGCRVTALDISRAGIAKLRRIARQEGLPIEARVADLATYRFPSGHYDLVVAASTLSHLDAAARARVVRGIGECLGRGGQAYVYVFTTMDPGFRLRSPLLEESERQATEAIASETRGAVVHYFQPGELRQLFPGFEIRLGGEGIEPDVSHGQPHLHGWADLVIRKL